MILLFFKNHYSVIHNSLAIISSAIIMIRKCLYGNILFEEISKLSRGATEKGHQVDFKKKSFTFVSRKNAPFMIGCIIYVSFQAQVITLLKR